MEKRLIYMKYMCMKNEVFTAKVKWKKISNLLLESISRNVLVYLK